jgi:DNA-binding NtrC family response regulator
MDRDYWVSSYIANEVLCKRVSPSELLNELEADVLTLTLHVCKFNQSRTAIALGWSRGTLRTKLKHHFGEKYFRNK